jgi:hypothetical protein
MAMTHDIHTIIRFEKVGTYILKIQFDDGSTQIIDFWPLLRGELYSPLRDPKFFDQVQLNADEGTLVWPNGADFDPATLHDWEQVGQAMIQMTATWPVVDVYPVDKSVATV